jgi:hypothetical protein
MQSLNKFGLLNEVDILNVADKVKIDIPKEKKDRVVEKIKSVNESRTEQFAKICQHNSCQKCDSCSVSRMELQAVNGTQEGVLFNTSDVELPLPNQLDQGEEVVGQGQLDLKGAAGSKDNQYKLFS